MKEREVGYSTHAIADLTEVYHWIADAASQKTALAYVARIDTFCRGFSIGAERGHRRDDIRPGLRIVGFERRITVAFTVDNGEVTIVRVFYGGRNWERMLE